MSLRKSSQGSPGMKCEELFKNTPFHDWYIYYTIDRLSTEIPEFACGPSRRHKVRVHYEEEVISDDDEYLCEWLLIFSTL